MPLSKVYTSKYIMERPLCVACNKNLAAINCYRNGQIYYRTRCDSCIRKGRKKKPAVPRWKQAGYKKKATCDRCGFKFKLQAQSMVFHIDGNLNNTNLTNLRTICLNCVAEINHAEVDWRPGDLAPDI